MEPKNTISQLKRLIGKRNGDSELAADVPTFSFQVQDGPEGVPQVNVQYLGEPRSFRPEQLLAALLGELKAIGEKDQGAKIADCVLSVPGFFTEQQRRAVLDAAHVAGLNILRLVHETTATALAFGIYKTDWTDKPQYFAFVDGGHASLQACGHKTRGAAGRSGAAAPGQHASAASTSRNPLAQRRAPFLLPWRRADTACLPGGRRGLHQGRPEGHGLRLRPQLRRPQLRRGACSAGEDARVGVTSVAAALPFSMAPGISMAFPPIEIRPRRAEWLRRCHQHQALLCASHRLHASLTPSGVCSPAPVPRQCAGSVQPPVRRVQGQVQD